MNVVTRGQTYLNDGDAVQIAFDDSTEDNIDTDNSYRQHNRHRTTIYNTSKREFC